MADSCTSACSCLRLSCSLGLRILAAALYSTNKRTRVCFTRLVSCLKAFTEHGFHFSFPQKNWNLFKNCVTIVRLQWEVSTFKYCSKFYKNNTFRPQKILFLFIFCNGLFWRRPIPWFTGHFGCLTLEKYLFYPVMFGDNIARVYVLFIIMKDFKSVTILLFSSTGLRRAMTEPSHSV